MFVRVKGSELACRVTGDGPPVVFIQGVGLHGDGWKPQTDFLASRFTCLSFDNRGVGQSPPSDPPLTIDQMAEDTLALMDSRGWGSAHIVGHSMGGLIAQHLALTARQRVRSLSLLCTFSAGKAATKPSPRMIWIGIRTRVGTRSGRRRAFLRMVMPPDLAATTDPRPLAALFGHDLADQPPIVMRQLSAMRKYDCTSRLPELQDLPTLVVSAEHDMIAKPHFGRAIATAIQGANFVEIPDAAHGVTIQCAGRVNEILLAHLAAAERRFQGD